MEYAKVSHAVRYYRYNLYFYSRLFIVINPSSTRVFTSFFWRAESYKGEPGLQYVPFLMSSSIKKISIMNLRKD